MKIHSHGFSLLELMIVVAIVGVLAAIAIPSYGNYVLRSNRTVAKTALSKIASQEEGYFSDRKSYANALNNIGSEYGTTANTTTVYLGRDGNVATATNTSAIYQVTLSNATATTYTVSAAPINNQAKDTRCGTLTLDNTGAKSASGTSPADCWTR